MTSKLYFAPRALIQLNKINNFREEKIDYDVYVMFGHYVGERLVIQDLEFIPPSPKGKEFINYEYIKNLFDDREDIGQCFLSVGLLYNNLQKMQQFDVTGTVTQFIETTPNFMKDALQININGDEIIDVQDNEIIYEPTIHITDIDKAVIVNFLKHNPYIFQ